MFLSSLLDPMILLLQSASLILSSTRQSTPQPYSLSPSQSCQLESFMLQPTLKCNFRILDVILWQFSLKPIYLFSSDISKYIPWFTKINLFWTWLKIVLKLIPTWGSGGIEILKRTVRKWKRIYTLSGDIYSTLSQAQHKCFVNVVCTTVRWSLFFLSEITMTFLSHLCLSCKYFSSDNN